jgi:hypothetical protein
VSQSARRTTVEGAYAIRRQTRQQPRARSNVIETALGWLGRLARFDYTAFDEIRAEPSATLSAVSVVVLASLMAGMGSWLWSVFELDRNETEIFIRSLLIGTIVQTLFWFLWVYIVHQLLTHIYHAQSNFTELVRVMGFAFFPVALTLFILVGALAIPIGIFAFSATILLSSIAVQSATDADAPHAMMATLLGFGAFLAFMGGFANVMEVDGLGGLAPGILFFALDF